MRIGIRRQALFPLLAALALFFSSTRQVEAGCVVSLPVGHFSTYFQNCPDAGQVAGYAYLLSNPAGVNSYDQDLVCEAYGEPTGVGPCLTDVGTHGDGRIAVSYNWGGGNYGALGCPVLSGDPTGSGRLVVIAAPQNGSSVVTSVAYSADYDGYSIDAAHPYDGISLTPLSCPAAGGGVLSLDGVSSSGGTITAEVATHPPIIHSDCDPGTAGEVLGTCPEGPAAIPAVSPGRFYTRTALCPEFGGKIALARQGYTLAADPDAGGHAQISIPAPTAGYCVTVGASFGLGGVETPMMGGYAVIPSDQACADADHDGFFDCLNDCDDANPASFPGNPEICDGVDNNCNGQIDEGIICQGGCFPPVKTGGDIPVGSQTWSYASEVSLVSSGSGYGATWYATQAGIFEVFFARLDSAGVQIGPTVQVSDAPFNSVSPRLVWTGSEYGLAWGDNRDGKYEIYFARLNSAGALIGTNTRVTFTQAGANYPSLVWTGQEFGLAWWDNRDSPYVAQIYFTRLSAAGAKIGGDLAVTTASASSRTPATLVWNGAGYAVSWSDPRDGQDRLYFARLSPTGVKLAAEQPIGVGSDSAPSAVWTGSGYGLAWSHDAHENIYFAVLDATGAPIIPSFWLTSNDGLTSAGPSLTWTGSEFGLAWWDGLNAVNPGDTEIRFASLTAQGQRIGQDFQVTQEHEKSAYPSLVWNGDGFALAWTLDHDNLSYQPTFTRIGCDAPDRDGDGFLAAVNDCNDGRRDVHPGAAEICDGIDNDCDGVVDNVLNGPGNACDLTDGVIWVAMPDTIAVGWQPETLFSAFNTYRGSLAVLRATGMYTQDPGTVSGAAKACGVAGTQTMSGPDPAVGEGFFYLVTGTTGTVEGSLGNDSAGRPRPNAHPCQ